MGPASTEKPVSMKNVNFALKLGPTALFTHLKIILLQYFQQCVFSFHQ